LIASLCCGFNFFHSLGNSENCIFHWPLFAHQLTIAAEKLNPDIYFLHQDAAALMAPNPASSDPVPK